MKRFAYGLIGWLGACVSLGAASQDAKVYTEWPFQAAEAERRQSETAKDTGYPVVLTTSLGAKDAPAITWRLIPAGTFTMGSPATEAGHEGDERQRQAKIVEPFYMMETQLTVEQYNALLHVAAEAGKEAELKWPAGISYRDTVDKVLPALAKCAPTGWKVILPEQERLQYAARAGAASMNPGGDKPEDADAFAWTKANSGGKIHPVAQLKPNAWGLFDVLGNRWHWFWRATGNFSNKSEGSHIVYGGCFKSGASGNGARLANLQISQGLEGARFALIRADSKAPDGHPETRNAEVKSEQPTNQTDK